MQAVISSGKSQNEQREYDKYLYRFRHLFENVYLQLKLWRGIAIRHAKNTASFLTAVHNQVYCNFCKIY